MVARILCSTVGKQTQFRNSKIKEHSMPIPNENSEHFLKQFKLLGQAYTGLDSHFRAFLERYPSGRKHCAACNKEHGISKFRVRTKEKGLLRSLCRESDLARGRVVYETSKKAVMQNVSKKKNTYRTRNRAHVQSYLADRRCSCCSRSGDSENPLRFYQDPTLCEQTVTMAAGGGLSLEAVDLAISRSTVLCQACLNQKSREELSYLWRLRDTLLSQNPKSTILSVFKKDVYRAYRPRFNTAYGLPMTSGQRAHVESLARSVGHGDDLILVGSFEPFLASLKEAKLNEPKKSTRKVLKRLRKTLLTTPDISVDLDLH